MAAPVRYLKTERGYVAYQTVGTGERDLLFMPDAFGDLDLQWDEPAYARSLHRLADLGRLIMVNRRGTGSSDPMLAGEEPSIVAWCDDVTAVLDELESSSTTIIATGGAAPAAVTLAAQDPARYGAVVLLGAWASLRRQDDYPIGLPDEALDLAAEVTEQMWGTGDMMLFGAPDRADDPRIRSWYARFERQSASPTEAAGIQQMLVDTDVRDLLPHVKTPTLVIHREADPVIPIALGRYIADRIPQAKFLSLPGSAHLCFGDAPLEWLEEVRHLLTGTRVSPVTERGLRTMLFSDIVDSTRIAARIGDERWRELLTKYEELLSAEIESSGGQLIDSQGDGHLATFESPVSAIGCARRIGEAVEPLGLSIRCGLHTGEVELRGPDIAGLAVHIAARVASQAGASEVLVSRTIVDLVVGSGIEFEPRGAHELKGVPGTWEIYAVSGVSP